MSKSGNKVPKRAMMCEPGVYDVLTRRLHVRQGREFTERSLQRHPCATGMMVTVISHTWIKHQGHQANAVM